MFANGRMHPVRSDKEIGFRGRTIGKMCGDRRVRVIFDSDEPLFPVHSYTVRFRSAQDKVVQGRASQVYRRMPESLLHIPIDSPEANARFGKEFKRRSHGAALDDLARQPDCGEHTHSIGSDLEAAPYPARARPRLE